MCRARTLLEARLSLIPIALNAVFVYIMSHSERGAMNGLVFDQSYSLQFILYGSLTGMIFALFFSLFWIAYRDSDVSPVVIFLLFPISLPLGLIFGYSDRPLPVRFSVLRCCLYVTALFSVTLFLAPHYEHNQRNQIVYAQHGTDLKTGITLTPVRKK